MRARPLKKLCLLVWLKTDLLKFIELWKPGLAESIYNYRPCSRWGLAPQPSTKGSPRFPAPGWPVPKELQRNSQRCIKRTCHVKANSNNLLLQYLPTYYQTQSSTNCRLGRWQSNNDNINLRKSFLARDYALNRSSTPRRVSRAIQQNPRRIMCAQSLLSSISLYT